MATPVHQHAEVEACLNDILNAVKGEEVRGSIYDAIQLIDQRSIALENEIRGSVEDIADEAVAKVINSFDLIYTFDSYGGITCNRTFTDIGDIMFSVGGKSPTYYIIAPNENTPKAAIGETVLAMVTPGDEFYESYIYTITETGLYSNITTINEYHIKHYQDRITFTDKTFQVQPKLIPGSNITIDETDPEHPVINSTGGGGGSAESFVININDIPPAALYINKTFNEIITQIGQDYGLIRVFLNYKDGYFNRKVEGIISHYESYGQEAHIQFRFNISNDKNNTIRYYLLELDNEFSLEDEYTQENQAKITGGDAIDITNNVISIGEPVYITMTEGANGIVDTSFIVSITEANFLAKFGIGAKDLMAILSGSYNVAKLGIKVYDDTSISMDAYLDKIPILDIRYSKYDEELSLAEGATMIFIWNHCTYEFTVNVEYSDEFRGTISKINGSVLKTLTVDTGYGINAGTNSISVDTSVIQKKLTSANAGTGISIANDGQGNPVISLDLPQAEGGGF